MTSEWTWPDGLEVDPEACTVRVCGRLMPVGHVMKMWFNEPSVWMSWLCGENGWWIDVACYPDGDIAAYTPDWCYGDEEYEGLSGVVELWRRCCAERRAVPTLTEYDSPFAGMEPGTWCGFEDPGPPDPALVELARQLAARVP